MNSPPRSELILTTGAYRSSKAFTSSLETDSQYAPEHRARVVLPILRRLSVAALFSRSLFDSLLQDDRNA